MGYPTTNPTLYPDKADVPASTHWEHPDANVVKARLQELAARVSYSVSISVKSSGTTVFVPAAPATPRACFVVAKNATASAMLKTSLAITNLTGAGITLKHGTHSKNGSAYATVFYD